MPKFGETANMMDRGEFVFVGSSEEISGIFCETWMQVDGAMSAVCVRRTDAEGNVISVTHYSHHWLFARQAAGK